jgi:hypothetical protein
MHIKRRPVLICAAVALIYVTSPASLRAAEGPWCAIINFGSDVTEDCQYHSLQECLPAVTAGFRGFCNQNPRWQGVTEPRQLRRKRAARPQQ